ncbi:hypothetical protein M011DRAFT_224890 [Sporormia fimetaria CBS 119925]|uniref:Uncharacterized protein n=1 Tax=Sporormia fimetaria CBS 119925 TaxID=1340428 RepID=A0A6A6V118_9PLEO|nr:hypothetical protein M011DRAFT_224890 [Sporormia fimetaria CBS 119925]
MDIEFRLVFSLAKLWSRLRVSILKFDQSLQMQTTRTHHSRIRRIRNPNTSPNTPPNNAAVAHNLSDFPTLGDHLLPLPLAHGNPRRSTNSTPHKHSNLHIPIYSALARGVHLRTNRRGIPAAPLSGNHTELQTESRAPLSHTTISARQLLPGEWVYASWFRAMPWAGGTARIHDLDRALSNVRRPAVPSP